jgi:peroxiredoxin
MLLPDVTFYMRERCDSIESENPFKWVYKTTKDLFSNKRVIIFGLPGAFTPTCSNSQLPNYEKMYNQFIEKGIDEIWCTSVNDAFVMYQWGLSQGLKNVKLLPDGNGDFAAGLGMLVKKKNLGFGDRSWRYAMEVNNLEIINKWVEDDLMNNCPTDPYQCSAPEYLIDQL